MLYSISDYQNNPVELSELRSLVRLTTIGCLWKKCDFNEAYLGKILPDLDEVQRLYFLEAVGLLRFAKLVNSNSEFVAINVQLCFDVLERADIREKFLNFELLVHACSICGKEQIFF